MGHAESQIFIKSLRHGFTVVELAVGEVVVVTLVEVFDGGGGGGGLGLNIMDSNFT